MEGEMHRIPGPMCLTSSLYRFSKHRPPYARHLEFKGPYHFRATPFSTEYLQSPRRGCSLKYHVNLDTRDAMLSLFLWLAFSEALKEEKKKRNVRLPVISKPADLVTRPNINKHGKDREMWKAKLQAAGNWRGGSGEGEARPGGWTGPGLHTPRGPVCRFQRSGVGAGRRRGTPQWPGQRWAGDEDNVYRSQEEMDLTHVRPSPRRPGKSPDWVGGGCVCVWKPQQGGRRPRT